MPNELYLFTYPILPLLVFFYIDDILILGSLYAKNTIEEIYRKLIDVYKIRRMKNFTSFLNARIVRYKGKLYILLN